jgi:hypothetical protein
MMNRTVLALAACLAVASPASAALVFSDNFNADAPLNNQTVFVNGWTVANGSVDVISGGFCGGGPCIDLDGSTSNAGEFTKALSLTGGITYTASYDLAGNQRIGVDIVDVSFGTATATYSFATLAPFATLSLAFTPGSSGTYNLTFANQGGDNVGAILDNVAVNAADAPPPGIPEPATWAMMVLGFSAAGAVVRRRKGALSPG